MSQVDDWADGYADSARDVNLYGPASANVPRSSVVSHQVRYRAPDTSDIPLAPGQNPEDSVYSNASGARMGQLKSRSGYTPPAGGGYTARTFPSSGAGAKRYARPKGTQSRSRGGAPANGVKTRSAPLSGADVTADVLRSVKAAGNTSFANWRQSLVNQGWSQAEADAVRYDPSTGKFMSNASGQAATDHYMREQADKDAGIMADNPEVEGKVSGQTPAGQTPAKTEGGAQPAPAKTEGGAQPAPAKTEGGTQPAPADDHEQEAKAAVDEFLKQHPADGKERLKAIYEALDSQNIKDDAAYNLAVIAEIQKAQTPAKTDTQTSAPVPGRSFITTENTGDNHVPDFGVQHAPAASGNNSDVDNLVNNPGNTEAVNEKVARDITEGLKVFGDPEKLALRAAAARDAYGSKLFHDAMDGNIVTPDSIRAAEYVRQLRAANAAKAQAAAEAAAVAAEQRSDNPEGWL